MPIDVEATSHQTDLTRNNEVPSTVQTLMVGNDVQQDVNPGVDLVELNAMEENATPQNQNMITLRESFLAIA